MAVQFTSATFLCIEGVEYLGNPIQVIVSCQPPTVAVEKTEETDEAVAADEVPASKVKDDVAAEGDAAE